MRRSFVEELDLNASEVEIVLDYFVYGRQLFKPDELAFVEGSKPDTIPVPHFKDYRSSTNMFGSKDLSQNHSSPDFLDSPELTAMLENQLEDISNFVNSEKGAPIQFHDGVPRVDRKYVNL